MSNDELKGNSEGNGAPDKDSQKAKGNPTGQSPASKDDTASKKAPDFTVELKRRDGTIAAQDKTINELKGQLQTLTTGLKSALGIQAEDDDKDASKVVDSVLKQVETLTGRLDKADAKEVLNSVLNDFRDTEGKELSGNIKDYLREKINPSKPDVEEIKNTVVSEVNSLSKLLGENSRLQVRDNAPDPKYSISNRVGPRPSANEILAAKRNN